MKALVAVMVAIIGIGMICFSDYGDELGGKAHGRRIKFGD